MTAMALPRLRLIRALSGVVSVWLPTAAVATGDGLRLEVNRPIEITCETKAVVVMPDGANATAGTMRISMRLKDDTARPKTGEWRIVQADPRHVGSLAVGGVQTCRDACTLTIAQDDQIQLWAPAPKSLDQLADGEKLVLAILKTANLDLRATSFVGKEIEALEEGFCKVAP